MAIRYRLVPFDSQSVTTEQAARDLLVDLGNFQQSPLANLSIFQWVSALKHALSAGARSILLQEAVKDPDFLEEYEAFYAKQQKDIPNLCRRLHFFTLEVPSNQPNEDIEAILNFIDTAAAVSPGSYLGFITIRPLRHAPVGASILTDQPTSIVTCRDEFPVHIAGREFSVSGTPYLQQDSAVGACAQVSIWVALRTLRKRLGNSAYSPAELTVAATKHFALNRVFPGRDGLTTHQMLEAIRSAGHDPLIIACKNSDPKIRAQEALSFSTPYLESGLPVIIGLNHPQWGGHAVAAIGYKPPPPGEILPDTLTIHNDNSGCYIDLPSATPANNGYGLSQAFTLITPLPDGICLTAAEAETMAITAIKFAQPFLISIPPIVQILPPNGSPGAPVNYVLRTFLSTRHSFRHWAANATDIDTPTKTKYRAAEFPRYIWVIEIHDQKLFKRGTVDACSRLGEIVADASADAQHGDALLFTRLSGLLIGSNAPDDGILLSEHPSGNRELLAIKAPASLPQREPWLQ